LTDLHYSLDDGVTWEPIVEATDNDGLYDWTIPDCLGSDECLVRVRDADAYNCFDVSDAVFTIVAPCEFTVLVPNGGEEWTAGETHEISWTSVCAGDLVNLYFSLDAGGTWETIVEDEANDGAYDWTIPNCIESDACRVRVEDAANTDCSDDSDDDFIITAPCTLTLTLPNGGEEWTAGALYEITWISECAGDLIEFHYSLDAGDTWELIAEDEPNDGTYEWTIPECIDSDACLVRVVDQGDPDCYDDSDAVFTIVAPCEYTLTVPNGGEEWITGAVYDISWSSECPGGLVNISLSVDGGENWTVIAGGITDDGIYEWAIPDGINSNQCLIRVADTDDPDCHDDSDAVFMITPLCGTEYLVITPNGGETWFAGQRYEIRYVWEIPEAIHSDECLVRVREVDNFSCVDESDDVFAITEPYCDYLVVAPNGGETWTAGETYEIQWTSIEWSSDYLGPNVDLLISLDDGLNWNVIVEDTENDGSHFWQIPENYDSDMCLVRVRRHSLPECFDDSDEPFTIEGLLARDNGESTTSVMAEPNPASAAGTVTFTVTGAVGDARVSVYDVTGRCVRTLKLSGSPQGVQRVMWDGRSDRGDQLDSGIYFYQLTYRGGSHTPKRIVMLK
jgi:hypothetical protein